MMRGKILYVEDDPQSLRLVQKILEIMDYNFLAAADGETGLQVALDEIPDVILMDIHLPDISGLEVIRRLRSVPAFQQVPIVAITADSRQNSERLCHDAGCDAYLTKPISKTRLLSLVQQLARYRDNAHSA